ncbi:MAG: TetR/AcrR family transcriptional regulator [Flavobacteriaceae bacterium]|nr:TetR/AcrR family transcriptional regulator [Flavobacteriaceae bacterium]
MENLAHNISISINEKLFLKNPESTALGKNIIEHSILLINEIGFENFTFKKLGEKIQSNESSIYRYFENKHKLLIYLSTWYWSWIEYRIVFSTHNVKLPIEKIEKTIEIIANNVENDDRTVHINESILNKIVIAEFSKTFLTKEVDQEIKEGFFNVYQRIVNRLENMITELNPNYTFAKTLASSIVQGALHQHYLKEHFSNLTNLSEVNSLNAFYVNLIKKVVL